MTELMVLPSDKKGIDKCIAKRLIANVTINY